MPDGHAPRPSMRDQVSPEEWRARQDCAALYRLAALEKWDDLIFTHISLRAPGPEEHFLINPYGWLFEEITASSLVKVTLAGDIVAAPPGAYINPAGFTIHSAIHEARADARCVIHLHTDAAVAVSAQREGLLPISQTALAVRADLAYHDYEGIALDLDERARLVADLGGKNLMLLRNHGALAIGENAAAAFLRIYFLERACRIQTMALSGAGADAPLIACDAAMQEKVGLQSQGLGFVAEALAWPALLRRLARLAPDYGD